MLAAAGAAGVQQQEVRTASVCVVVPAEETNIAEEPLQLTPPKILQLQTAVLSLSLL